MCLQQSFQKYLSSAAGWRLHVHQYCIALCMDLRAVGEHSVHRLPCFLEACSMGSDSCLHPKAVQGRCSKLRPWTHCSSSNASEVNPTTFMGSGSFAEQSRAVFKPATWLCQIGHGLGHPKITEGVRNDAWCWSVSMQKHAVQREAERK